MIGRTLKYVLQFFVVDMRISILFLVLMLSAQQQCAVTGIVDAYITLCETCTTLQELSLLLVQL
jgi:hypothetical protein